MRGILAGLVVAAPIAAGAADRAIELAAVVQAERDFAARAQVVNARQAFAENFAPGALVYSPFATPAFPDLDAPGKDWPVNIRWRPAAAAISGAGDMAYTTGPAEFRKTAAEAPFRYGHYTSVWERQPDGRYKVVIDIGVNHPPPVSAIPDWMPSPGPPADVPAASDAEQQAARTALLDLDTATGAAAADDTVRAIGRVLAEDGRYHQPGALPAVGRTAALERLRASDMTQRWAPSGGKVSRSADFGFTYGRGSFTQAGDPATGDLAYLNIWQRRAGAWTLLVRVVSLVPPAPPTP